MAEVQTIPARHGVATFVPAGQTIKIINTSGTQVVDTWAFALPAPDPKKKDGTTAQEAQADETKDGLKKTKGSEFPSQEEAEKATQQAEEETPKKSTWSSYVPSLGLSGKKKEQDGANNTQDGDAAEQQKKNSKTWGEYFTAGKGFSSYIPKQATDTVSQFAATHERDRNKSYLDQLQDFSRTPVGAAGMAAMTGSGYAGSLYAGYQAWNLKHAANAPATEFMSMPHTRAATLHLRPKVQDTLVTNLREPILTLVEDTSVGGGVHDTLIAACDPQRYKGLGVSEWEQHGSCAENLVLALKELNERAGLKGAKAVGAEVTINSVPGPLNLWMNIPWDEEGDLGFKAPRAKKGDFVRFRAERDVVVVMSACPQDVLEINNKMPTDAGFVVEEEDVREKISSAAAMPAKKKSYAPARKVESEAQSKPAPTKKKPPPPRVPPPQKKVDGNAPQPVKKTPTAQPLKKPAQAAPASTPARSTKKPIPPPVKNAASTNGSEPIPAERRKPRKLTRPGQAAC